MALRYAILSDVHSNLAALEKVLAEVKALGVDSVLCAGDVVGYGPQPNECCEALRELDAQVVRGNHDQAAFTPGKEDWFTTGARTCILWTREVLTPENLEFLQNLRPSLQVAGAHLCHGSLPDPDLYTTSPREAQASFELMDEPLCFLGHTHYAEWYIYRNDGRPATHHPRAEGGELGLTAGRAYIVNPGSVGQPRDGNSQASFATWDSAANVVTIHRVSYDVAETQRLILEAGLPRNMADRLRYGT